MDPKTALGWLLANSYKDGDIVKIPADIFYKTVKAALTGEEEQESTGMNLLSGADIVLTYDTDRKVYKASVIVGGSMSTAEDVDPVAAVGQVIARQAGYKTGAALGQAVQKDGQDRREARERNQYK